MNFCKNAPLGDEIDRDSSAAGGFSNSSACQYRKSGENINIVFLNVTTDTSTLNLIKIIKRAGDRGGDGDGGGGGGDSSLPGKANSKGERWHATVNPQGINYRVDELLGHAN